MEKKAKAINAHQKKVAIKSTLERLRRLKRDHVLGIMHQSQVLLTKQQIELNKADPNVKNR